jgi:hypothetical protein
MCVMRNTYPVLQQLKFYFFLPLFFVFGSIASAQKKITGIVLSDNNLPLSEATVTLKNSGIATTTLSDGSLVINAQTSDVLEVFFIQS